MATKEKSQDFLSKSESLTKDAFQELKEFIVKQIQGIQTQIQEIKETLEQKYDNLKQDILTVATGLSTVIKQVDKKVYDLASELDIRMEETDSKIINMDNKLQLLEKELVTLQFKSKESAIRLRGVEEYNGEDIFVVCADVLAVLLQLSPAMVLSKIDKAYRVNSRVAKERQLPRDVVIYFTDRNIRNEILKKSFASPIQIKGRKILTFKELPPKILKDRKKFAFLVTELKKQQIQFKWDFPLGIILWFHGKRYQLDTLEKAEEFYFNILKNEMVFSSETLVPVDGVKKLEPKMQLQENQKNGAAYLSETLLSVDKVKKMEPKMEAQENQIDLYPQAMSEIKQTPQQLHQNQMNQPARIKGVKGKQKNNRKYGKK